MSIASRTNSERGGSREFPDTLLTEPENADIIISHIKDGGDRAARAVADALLLIRRGVEEGVTNKVESTIDLFTELAFLETDEYKEAHERFRAGLEGRLLPDEEIQPKREGVAKATERVSDERVNNVMRLGDQLLDLLKNSELPRVLRDEIGHALSDLINDATPRTTLVDDFEENWPRIAEMLLAQPQQKGDEEETDRGAEA